MAHFFEIKRTKSNQFMSVFKYNSEPIVWSEQLTTKVNAQNNIASVKNNAEYAQIVDRTKNESGTGYRFEIFATTDSQFMVRFKAPNGETVVVSERYTAKHNAINAASSVKQNAKYAPIIDNSDERAA